LGTYYDPSFGIRMISKERLAQLRQYRDLFEKDWQLGAEATETEGIGEPFTDAMSEVDRLEKENEWLSQVYYCPTSKQMEHPFDGGFTICCTQPDKHIPMPKGRL